MARRMSSVAEVQALFFLTFTALLVACAVSVTVRAIDLRAAKQPVPILLWRDLAFLILLAFPFVAILFARWQGLGPQLVGDLTWTVVTSVPAIAALVLFIAAEILIVGKRR